MRTLHALAITSVDANRNANACLLNPETLPLTAYRGKKRHRSERLRRTRIPMNPDVGSDRVADRKAHAEIDVGRLIDNQQTDL